MSSSISYWGGHTNHWLCVKYLQESVPIVKRIADSGTALRGTRCFLWGVWVKVWGHFFLSPSFKRLSCSAYEVISLCLLTS